MDQGSSGMTGMTGMTGMSGTPSGGAPTGSAAADVGRAGDVMFAQMMIPHHQQAVEMADIALAKPGSSAQVRELATQIKAGQDPEIQTMRGWLQSWGAPEPTTGMSGMSGMSGQGGQGMMTQADMDALKAADGAAFDKQWVTMMTAHHQGAITMAKQVLGTTQNPQVKTLAEAVVKAQTEEIATMKTLL
ncbi:DUF305 domain-containing protein [Terrabacter sp. NPDC000476]|uniref:DUF305 domain-containing protein n=1 Tax=Terrabacter sp. NPDC000476 TaxID=3154258 RepID=UPI003333F234